MGRRTMVRVTFHLLIIDALLWLIFTIITTTRCHPALPDSPILRWVTAFLALAACVALPGLYLLARRFGRVGFYPLLALLVLISLLTLTDEFGLADLIILILHLSPMVLLVLDRATYRTASRR